MRVLILTGGSLDTEFTDRYLLDCAPQYVIAADRGMEYFRMRALTPDCIVGDFDSVSQETLDYFHKIPQIVWKQFRPEKDETDTELAMRVAFEHGARELHILGATGTRLDHVIGNIRLLHQALTRDVAAYLVDRHNRISLTDQEMRIKKTEQFGTYVSILPFTETVEGITLKGFRYPLSGAVIRNDVTLGISNEIVGEEASIKVERGVAIVIESRD